MTRAEQLLALAERVERATGADRELDGDIFCALGLAQLIEGAFDAYRAPAYTASLDAALTLVPEGWSIQMLLSENGKYPCVKLGRSHPENMCVAQEGHILPATVASAALRAIAAQEASA